MTGGIGAMKNIPFEHFRGLPRDVQIQRMKRVIQGELTELQRYTLQEYYFADKTLQQIADSRNVERSTVWRTLKRAEEKLRRVLSY